MKPSSIPALVLSLLAWTTACTPAKTTPDAGVPWTPGWFPAGFLWGTATAGFQVEAGCPTIPAAECEDRNSDWYQFVMDPELRAEMGNHLSGQDISAASGFYELYESDIGLVKNGLSSNAFRVGVEWSRIFPTSTVGVTDHAALRALASPAGLDFYRRVFTAARAQDIKLLVTLNHYVLPLWMHDGKACHQNVDTCTARGWLDSNIIPELAKFSGFVAREYGDLVDLWATQNEPLAVVVAGYAQPTETRTNPPALSFRFAEARTVAANMQIAHARQYDAVKANDTVDVDGDGKVAEVGLVYNVAPVHPRDPNNALDVLAAQDTDYLYNQAFLNGIIRGDLDADLDGVPEHRADLENRMDYIGLNYYTRIVLAGTSDGNPVFPEFSIKTTFDPLSIMQGPPYAKGIYEAIMAMKAYNLPILITENGAADDPLDAELGPRFLVEHLTWVSRAIRDGANVRGYFWWSLMDNFEWNHGMSMRFGLYAVAPDAQKTRTPRAMAPMFQRVASGNALPADLMARYPVPE